jgi:fructose-bisphosphate aldolase class II
MKEIISDASKNNYIIPGFNIFGYEDSMAVVKAAEELNKPTLLMVNKLACEHMPIEYWAKLLRAIAKDSKVSIGVHLDHCNDFDVVVRAIKSGFSSVMYDGSQLSIEENISRTKEIVKVARVFDVAVEGEVGSVPYADIPGHAKDILTSVDEASQFADNSGVDWVAVAVGQVHRLQNSKCNINFDSLEEIQNKVSIPIVIHGGSGIREEDLIKMTSYGVGKINVGTSLRMAFGEKLKQQIINNPNEFDRIKLFEEPSKAVVEAVKKVYEVLNPNK